MKPKTLFRSILIRFPILAGLLAGCMNQTSETPTATITLLPAETYQTIENFGASGAWWAQDVGGWEDEKRNRVVTLLFDQQAGIGLSLYRYNIGGGIANNIQDPWRTAETFEVSPGVYDWSRDANAMWVLKAVKAAGVDQFVAFVNSPPARMTISGFTTGEAKGRTNITPEMYGEFAQYMVDVVRHLRDVEGIPIGWISPVNEPQWDWNYEKGQEGAHYGPADVLEVTRALLRAIEADAIDVKVSVFESGEWKKSQVYIDKLLKDPEVAPHLEHIALHSYWSKAEDKTPIVNFMERNFSGVKLWQTEWTEMKEGRDVKMPSALLLANTIHEDLTIGGVTAWQYWIAVSRYLYRDGLIYVNLSDREIIETKKLWVMGNYSRYIRPGYERVGVDVDSHGLSVSAYRSPESNQFVVVIINDEKKSITANVAGVPEEFTQVSQHETSAQNDLAEVYVGDVKTVFTFPAESVTTLVFEKP